MLSLRLHARTIGWVAGLATITLTLAAIGILQSVRSGDSVVRAGTVVESSSNQSIHVRVRLENGDSVLVPREHHVGLAVGDAVTLLESTSALSTVGYRLADIDAD